VLLHHIPAIMSTCLSLSSGHAPASAAASRRTSIDEAGNGAALPAAEQYDPREEAAAEAVLAVALAADEDSLHCLVTELLKALEDVGGRALGAARLLAAYAKATRQDLQPHVDELMTVSWLGGDCRGTGADSSQRCCSCLQHPALLLLWAVLVCGMSLLWLRLLALVGIKGLHAIELKLAWRAVSVHKGWLVMANLSFDCSLCCILMQLLPLSLKPARKCTAFGFWPVC
jgi:hypothetical protein